MRTEDFDMNKLQHYRLIHRVMCNKNNLKVSDLDLLLYLSPIEYFTINDFKHGTLIISWENSRFYRLQKEGWIKKVYDGRGSAQHNKYAVSQKSKLLIARMGRIIDGKEDLPKILSPKTYREKTLRTQINKYNERKYERLYGQG